MALTPNEVREFLVDAVFFAGDHCGEVVAVKTISRDPLVIAFAPWANFVTGPSQRFQITVAAVPAPAPANPAGDDD